MGGRIIPARAGFTRDDPPAGRRAGDHPRSRGVYPYSATGWEPGPGSSPLARGLRMSSIGLPERTRIIPARAGFTCTRHSDRNRAWDHPRSRGVYLEEARNALRFTGSSPLARGLPAVYDVGVRIDRIIPARAGFTDVFAGGCDGDADHPRSRGVYKIRHRMTKRGQGSSPLARGLLLWPLTLVRTGGIIPARAGFTRSPQANTWTCWIIPARAGFTLADPWNPNEPVLYQTPAAFTADPGPAPPSCGSAVVVPRWTTTPSGA